MLKSLDAHTGELKRPFVTDGTRGTGTGKALVEIRIEAAKQTGLKRLIVDALTVSVEMRNLYPKLGFTEVPELPESSTFKDQPILHPTSTPSSRISPRPRHGRGDHSAIRQFKASRWVSTHSFEKLPRRTPSI